LPVSKPHVEETKPSVVSLFSGCGGMDIGFIQAGFQVLWANDLNKDACKTYSENIGMHVVCSDISQIDLETIPECDVVIGGPPCQGFSVAGKMDPSDPRSQLIWSFFEVVVAKRPRFFVMENVKSLGTLAKFAAILETLLNSFRQAGYQVRFEIMNSAAYGVPQARHRFILIGSLDEGTPIVFPKPSDQRISVRAAIGDLPPAGTGINQGICKAKITIAKRPVRRRSPFAGMLFNGSGRPLDLELPACTLPATMGGNRTPIIEQNLLEDPSAQSWIRAYHATIRANEEFDTHQIHTPPYLRRLTVRECARLQGFPDEFSFCGSQSQQFSQIGNAVPPPLAYEIAKALIPALTLMTQQKNNFQLPDLIRPGHIT